MQSYTYKETIPGFLFPTLLQGVEDEAKLDENYIRPLTLYQPSQGYNTEYSTGYNTGSSTDYGTPLHNNELANTFAESYASPVDTYSTIKDSYEAPHEPYQYKYYAPLTRYEPPKDTPTVISSNFKRTELQPHPVFILDHPSQEFVGDFASTKHADSYIADTVSNSLADSYIGERSPGHHADSYIGDKAPGYRANSYIGDTASSYHADSYIGDTAPGYRDDSYIEGTVPGYHADSYVEETAPGYYTDSYVEETASGYHTDSYIGDTASGYQTDSYSGDTASGYQTDSYIGDTVPDHLSSDFPPPDKYNKKRVSVQQMNSFLDGLLQFSMKNGYFKGNASSYNDIAAVKDQLYPDIDPDNAMHKFENKVEEFSFWNPFFSSSQFDYEHERAFL